MIHSDHDPLVSGTLYKLFYTSFTFTRNKKKRLITANHSGKKGSNMEIFAKSQYINFLFDYGKNCRYRPNAFL